MQQQKFGAGVFLICPKTNKILLVLRNDHTPSWAILGGTAESMEQPIQCAKRELLEEAKFCDGIDFKLKDENPLFVFSTAVFQYYSYLGIMDHERIPILNYENVRYQWFSLDELPTPVHFGVNMILKDQDAMRRIRQEFESFNSPDSNIDVLRTPVKSGN